MSTVFSGGAHVGLDGTVRSGGGARWMAAALAAATVTTALPCCAGEVAVRPRWASRLFAAESAAAPHRAETGRCADPATEASAGRCLPHLVGHDIAHVFTAPARWKAREWTFFSMGVVGVAVVGMADNALRSVVRRGAGDGGIADDVAKAFEPLGTWGSFLVLAGFYTGGAAAGDGKARGVAIDGLAATVIASGIITPVLKKAFGRSRPNAGEGPADFHPFQGGAALPSGHTTQAFAVASVIATEYRSPWVQVACYVPASLVGFARMRHDAHWASDVTAGALIGYGVGSSVARLNLAARTSAKKVRVMPLLSPGAQGVAVTASF
jgi:membrane-associated phospholipid phosphatase